jgi:hypothetical protein
MWLPDAYESACLTYEPLPSVGVTMPAHTRTVSHRAGGGPLEEVPDVKVPALFLTLEGVTDEYATVFIWHEDDKGTLNPYRLGNLYEDGHVCWGSSNDCPATPREAWDIYWSAPFNTDLWRSKTAHKCERQGGIVHRCRPSEGYPCVCQPTTHTCPVRHRHKCSGRSRMRRNGGDMSFLCQPRCRRVPHDGKRELHASPREEVYVPAVQYDDDGAAYYKPAYQEDFPKGTRFYKDGLGSARAAHELAYTGNCLCCARRCGCRAECLCCRKKCECHVKETCPCHNGACACPRECLCATGRCGCQPEESCGCSLLEIHRKYLLEYNVLDRACPDNGGERDDVPTRFISRPTRVSRFPKRKTATVQGKGLDRAEAVLCLTGERAKGLPVEWRFKQEDGQYAPEVLVFGRRTAPDRWLVWRDDAEDAREVTWDRTSRAARDALLAAEGWLKVAPERPAWLKTILSWRKDNHAHRGKRLPPIVKPGQPLPKLACRLGRRDQAGWIDPYILSALPAGTVLAGPYNLTDGSHDSIRLRAVLPNGRWFWAPQSTLKNWPYRLAEVGEAVPEPVEEPEEV